MVNKSIKELTDKLFSAAFFSKNTNDAKKIVSEALNSQYNQLIDAGQTDIEAMGNVMAANGTLKKAGSTAGFSDEEISGWSRDTDVISEKDFIKFFKKNRWRSYILSFSAAWIIITLITFLAYNMLSLEKVSGIVIFALPGIICGCFLHRNKRKISYEQSIFSTQAREYIDKMFDKYSKRLLNSIYFVIGILFIEVYMFFISVLQNNMTVSEAFTSLFSGSKPYSLIGYILFKNYLCKYLLDKQYDSNKNDKFKKYAVISVSVSVVYWIAVVTVTLLLRNKTDFIFNIIIAAMIIYFIGVLASNLSFRKKIMFNNLAVNIKRVVVVSVLILAVSSYQIMKMDVFLLQPYISTVKPFNNDPDKIEYNEETGVYTITTDKEDFRILQLTDIHLGGSVVSVYKDFKALTACENLISETRPDLVVVTGDLVFPLGIMSFSLNNTAPITEFANFMRNMDVPWVFTFGNHDTELLANGSRGDVIYQLESLSYETSQNLLYPYYEPDITGRNNQLIKIRNADNTLNQAIFLLDSNDYIDGVNNYDYIHDDQVEWYRSQIEEMNEEEGKTVSSLLFFHMPLQEYRTAYELYEEGSDTVKYFFGANNEKMIDKVCCSDYPSKLFQTAKEAGSTKAMFCGHDHYNNLSVEYQGIRLTYGMSIDYLAMPGIEDDTEQRGGTLITLHKDSSYDIEQVKLEK